MGFLNLSRYFIFILFLASPVGAEPVVETDYSYYSVSALTKQELPARLDRATPIRIDAKSFYGYTRSNIDWQFWWEMNNHRCRITRVEVFLEVIFTLPKLENSPAEVYQVWNRWYPRLVRHEKGHQNNALGVARRIEKGILGLPPRRSCKALERAGNQLGQKLIEELSRIDESYDRRTNHGATEGAGLQSYL